LDEENGRGGRLTVTVHREVVMIITSIGQQVNHLARFIYSQNRNIVSVLVEAGKISPSRAEIAEMVAKRFAHPGLKLSERLAELARKGR
jgi:hypothetical protein